MFTYLVEGGEIFSCDFFDFYMAYSFSATLISVHHLPAPSIRDSFADSQSFYRLHIIRKKVTHKNK